MTQRTPAEVFAPGEFIREELEVRGWSQNDLAAILGRPPRVVSEVVTGKRAITPETAKGLGNAFGTGAQFWMNLESAYQLAQVRTEDGTVARRAKLYELAPIKEMIRRRWIEHSESIDVLEKRVMDFFEITSLDQQPSFLAHAARKSTSYETATSAQLAWLFRAKKLANAVPAQGFSDRSFDTCLMSLKQILPNPQEVRQVPRILGESGIRFLVIEPLTQTKIDGVCFWLSKDSPVIALSLRYDRIDWFWHTLLHELAHVHNRDGLNQEVTIDTDLVGDQAQAFEKKSKFEQQADKFAADFSIPQGELRHFIARVRPLYSQQKILGFASRICVHPGIVVGQLQYRAEVSYAHSRRMLVRVRGIITSTALTDGWGNMPPVIV